MTALTALTASAHAEFLRLRRWPAVWVVLGAFLLLNLVFGYLFPYLSYRSGGGSFGTEGIPPDRLLADVLPTAMPATMISGMPMFGGALLLTLGAMAAGSGYSWGTWKTVLTQGPGRLATVGGTLAAVLGTVVAVVVVTATVDLGVAAVLAGVEGQPIGWPPVGDTAVALGGGLLVLGMWALIGFAVGTLARGPALAVGLGLVWVLLLENLLRGVASLLDWLEPVTNVLPGTAVGSVAGAVGATPVSQPDGTPGVLDTLSGGTATALAAAYAVAFCLLTAVLVRRRDVA